MRPVAQSLGIRVSLKEGEADEKRGAAIGLLHVSLLSPDGVVGANELVYKATRLVSYIRSKSRSQNVLLGSS